MPARRHHGTVLIITADADARRAWTAALEAEEHAVVAVGAVPEAVGHAREGGIDAVVFDASERPQDGRTLVDALDRLPEPPPLVLVSSSSHGPELSARLGAAAFVPKPCADEDIVGECLRLLASRPRPRPDTAGDDPPTDDA
ncbi:MAG: response regulator [Myxococcales bacterium]|nr:response regulator [Myxococcales bacterium]